MNKTRKGMRVCAAAIFVSATLLATAASAHVSVSSPDAEADGYGKLVFRVPTESDTASTNKIQVDLPKDTLFSSVSTESKPGWKATLQTKKHDKPVKVGGFEITETVSSVTWTATAGGIAPSEFGEFALSVGPFPADASKPLAFSVIQSYDDGETVAWDEASKDGAEAEHPAPVFSLDGSADHHGKEADSKEADNKQSSATADEPDNVARGLGAAALLLAALGLVLILRNNGRRA